MRTTLDVADDILAAVRERARREGRSIGAVLSDLARDALTASPAPGDDTFFGFAPLPASGRIVTSEQVARLRDEEGV